jgi:peptidoglycan/LPS O-acetylase OafA/YrhL
MISGTLGPISKMSDPVQALRYRPEIDGLRAVAVVAVVAYHAGLGLPGGYVGVDVFFVISGYLITSLILKELDQGSFSLSVFWERRARRILPALVVVTLATLGAGYFLLLPTDFVALGKAVAAQAGFAANLYYWRDTGYFSGGADQKVLLHTWSLAVEEQFYLLLPLALFAAFRFAPVHLRPATTRSLFIAGILGSLALSVYAVPRHPAAAFYLLPTRAWELLLGATLAVFPAQWTPTNRDVREWATVLGLAAILVPCFVYTGETPFPGLAAIPPCFGTALLIWGTTRKEEGDPQPLLGWLLASPIFVFVGLVSYSFYLWHWPLFAFSTYWAVEPLSLRFRASLVGLGFLLAFASWRFVETPFRTRQVVPSRRGIRVFAVSSLVVVLIGGASVVAMEGLPERFSPEVLAYANGRNDSAFAIDLTVEDIQRENLVQIGAREQGAPVRVVVWGDSFAMAAAPAFDSLLKERGISGRAVAHSSTAPLLGFFKKKKFGLNEDAWQFNEAVLAFIEAHSPSDVFLVAQWKSYEGDSDGPNSISLDSALRGTVQRLKSAGTRPWVLLQVPAQSFDVPRALARAALLGEDIGALCTKREAWNGLSGEGNAIFRAIEAEGGRVVDPRPRFLDPAGRCFVAAKGGHPLYRDSGHLTTKGAELMLLPLLREAFADVNPPSSPSTFAVPR